MAKKQIAAAILASLDDRARLNLAPVSADEITTQLAEKRPTVNRYLATLVKDGSILKLGMGPATRYRSAKSTVHELSGTISTQSSVQARLTTSPSWSAKALELRAQLVAPIATRTPVTYQRQFVDGYVPNQSSLLPVNLAASLFASGRARGQQPASTYARKVLEQLLIDLSWYSSRLEGNQKSLLDTKELFAKGRTAGDDLDAAMLLNHKDAIEFMVDAVPEYGITMAVVRNIQSLFSVYIPTQIPDLLEEMLGLTIEKARQVKNPVEAAFFLWVNIAYLQPFEDGNKRTSRLSANLPLMLSNCAPLSFLDVEQEDYAIAVTGVYERLDVTLAVELFAWTYRRSIDKYKVVLESMGVPDPFRSRLREQLADAIRQVVLENASAADACAALSLAPADQEEFRALLRKELRGLEPFNCARYRLSIRKTEEWIGNGRPG